MPTTPRRTRGPLAVTAWSLAGVLTAFTALTGSAVSLPAPAPDRPDDVPVVSGSDVDTSINHSGVDQTLAGVATAVLPPPLWPAAGDFDIELTDASARPAGGSGVSVSAVPGGGDAVSSVHLEVKAHEDAVAAGYGDGVVMELSRSDGGGEGTVSVNVDYSAYAHAYGGDWDSRLALWTVPDCPGCAPEKLNTDNDAGGDTATAVVPVSSAPTTVVLAADPAGESGDFSASKLSPSATWASGTNAGPFTWSYPMGTPDPVGTGLTPIVELSYSSASVDGRSEATNNQPGRIGEGFSYSPGFIERRYTSCSNDMDGGNNSSETGDKCWKLQNASLSMSGHAGELVKDDGDGTWRLKNDDGTRIELLDNTNNADDDNEYWKLTTADGTRYFFGRNRLPGWSSGEETTDSVATVPVAGNHSGEPCHASAFADSFCDQAYKWMLDYVVDPSGNTISYWYDTETNEYAENADTSNPVAYTRAIRLDRIDYGTDNRDGSEYTGTAPARVTFTYADRCLSDCGTKDEAHWPDTPWDLECSGSTCTNNTSPVFWDTKRLTKVTTNVWDTGLGQYAPVDSWTMTHSFPDPGDGTRAGLWLESITRTGHVGGDLALPSIEFDWIQMYNRVDTLDGVGTMNWMRMGVIWTETGGQISIAYTPRDCTTGDLPTSPGANDRRCYPVKVPDPDNPDSLVTHWYHKYLVTSVTEYDQLEGLNAKVTSYEYVGTPAWRFAAPNALVEDKYRTWSDYRGYSTVRVRVGQPGDQTLTETTYFRGMDGDKLDGGGTRSVTVPASTGAAIPDDDLYSGMVRESTVYNGTGDKPVSRTVNEPWKSTPTASRTVDGDTTEARYVRSNKVTYHQTALDAGRGWRTTKTTTTYDDAYGTVTTVEDLGDTAVTGDEKCTHTEYARNTGANILDTVSRTYTYALPCGTGPAGADDVIGDTRYSFDGQAYGQAPVKGLVTRTEIAKDWVNNAPVWLTTSASDYDAYGRVEAVTDVKANTTTTAYSPATGPVAAISTTGPMGWTTVNDKDLRGTNVKTTDINGNVTELAYDPLGRLTKVWKANHRRIYYPDKPSMEFVYTISKTGRNAVTTKTIHARGAYAISHVLYDGLLRRRQTQSLSPGDGGGRIITDTLYDDHGRAYMSYGPYVATGTPSTTLYVANPGEVVRKTETVFDRADRATAVITYDLYAELWRTTTAYGGDHTTVIPPSGGVPTTTYTDVHGNTTELRQHLTPDASGDYITIGYDYDRKQRLSTVTGPDGSVWSYGYDFRGRKTSSTDPDSGTTTSEYNDAGELTATTSVLGTLVYTYDDLGRKTGMYDGQVAVENKRAEWRYDTTLANSAKAKGRLAGWSRFADGGEYRYDVQAYTSLYMSVGGTYTIPDTETGLAGTYRYGQSYARDGTSPTILTVPAAGGLGQESTTIVYDDVTGLPVRMTGGLQQGGYVRDTDYTGYGEIQKLSLQHYIYNSAEQSYFYDDATRRLTRSTVLAQSVTGYVADTNYTYDPAGNITSISEQVEGDTQCFAYDSLRRLSDAWTPGSGDCAQVPSVAGLGGPAPYWHSYSFDDAGNRLSWTRHDDDGGETTTYAYADPAHPHAITGTDTTLPSGSTVQDTYAYDPAGNLIDRDLADGTGQELTWNPEGRLDTLTDTAGDAEHVYTPDGQRLIRRDATGATLYLPGQEIRYDTAGAATSCTRYYSYSGKTIAVRTTANGLHWLFSDHQTTATIAINQGNPQMVTKRRQDPYGNPRGATTTSWPDTHGFQNGVNDPSGLTHIGAREYAPTLGAFITQDPVTDTADTQQLQGYAYASGNPIVYADPTGMMRVRQEDFGHGGPGAKEYYEKIFGDYHNWEDEKDANPQAPGAWDPNSTVAYGPDGADSDCWSWDVLCDTPIEDFGDNLSEGVENFDLKLPGSFGICTSVGWQAVVGAGVDGCIVITADDGIAWTHRVSSGVGPSVSLDGGLGIMMSSSDTFSDLAGGDVYVSGAAGEFVTVEGEVGLTAAGDLERLADYRARY